MKYLAIIILFLIGCNSQQNSPKEYSDTRATNHYWQNHKHTTNNNDNNSTQSEEGEDNSSSENEHYSDGTHSATVEYNNPATGYSATYTLDVEVEDGEVRQIDWPNGGWSDEHHITPAELDEDGHAEIEGENGKTYDVQLDETPDESSNDDDNSQ